MAYSITKPNIYFSGDKRILTETVAGSVSKFNIVMTHAKDSMYYVIDNSTKDTIEIAIEPFKTNTNCVLTNYIMFPNDFSSKAISFVAPDGYEIYYTGDYTRAKYTENTIIAIQHVDMNKIAVTINAGEKTEKYGVLLTLETTTANETVYYRDPADNIDLSNVKMYWDYDPVTGELGPETHDNSKVYSNAGKHYLVVISDASLKFPGHRYFNSPCIDISNHLIEISKYDKMHKAILTTQGNYFFAVYKKLKKINTNEIFGVSSYHDFNHCFVDCSSLTYIPENLFDNCTEVKYFSYCFYNCPSLTSIPEHLFDKNTKVTSFSGCFGICTSLTFIPPGLFDKNTEVTDFSYCFNCCALTSIPEHLFDKNTKVTTFQQCFGLNPSLTSIPDHLFDKNTAVTNFKDCFGTCSSLAYIPENLFDNNIEITNIEYCFYRCKSVTSYVPELWNNVKWPNIEFHSRCFNSCNNAKNYSAIPTGWK